jgi:hypothetical protein
MTYTRHSGKDRAPSKAFQRYPGGEVSKPDTSLRWYDVIRLPQKRFA